VTAILKLQVLKEEQRILISLHEGNLSGKMLSKGTASVIRDTTEVAISDKTLKMVGDNSLYASFQFSFRNMFIWSPGTLIVVGS